MSGSARFEQENYPRPKNTIAEVTQAACVAFADEASKLLHSNNSKEDTGKDDSDSNIDSVKNQSEGKDRSGIGNGDSNGSDFVKAMQELFDLARQNNGDQQPAFTRRRR